jgi:hypothetical protein
MALLWVSFPTHLAECGRPILSVKACSGSELVPKMLDSTSLSWRSDGDMKVELVPKDVLSFRLKRWYRFFAARGVRPTK